jgi:hypothetical protein
MAKFGEGKGWMAKMRRMGGYVEGNEWLSWAG